MKSVRLIARAYEVQSVNYLVATGKPVGLVLNFGVIKVEIKLKIKGFLMINRKNYPVYPVNLSKIIKCLWVFPGYSPKGLESKFKNCHD